jgi:hypothetical protein
MASLPNLDKCLDKVNNCIQAALIEKGYLEHQATIAKLSAHMGLGHQVGAQGPCGHQVL